MAPITQMIRRPHPDNSTETRMIGFDGGLRNVHDFIRQVAPTGSTVLILGESGTGKELIAKTIHEQSQRSNGPFIKVNCAAMPGGLLESELFGHERGAYTGAFTQTMGRFQLAHQGTLFLDEIGDLPLELQPKLLRVLQEQEFERLGSTRTIRVDVRVVAATNQNLLQMVHERRFRADLYYRLNVLPISLPALRERPDDIPALVDYFVRGLARRMQKEICHVPNEVMELLKLHDWPGNVRELQNLMERAVILCDGPELRLPAGALKQLVKTNNPSALQTLAEAERGHILQVLRQVSGVIGGRHGAAARLGLPRTTLLYRMRKLGIDQSNVTAMPAPVSQA